MATAQPIIPYSNALCINLFRANTMSSLRRLRLVVFDLDYTIWQPEMYQLNGSPKLTPISSLGKISDSLVQEARTNQNGKVLTDKSQTLITVFEAA